MKTITPLFLLTYSLCMNTMIYGIKEKRTDTFNTTNEVIQYLGLKSGDPVDEKRATLVKNVLKEKLPESTTAKLQVKYDSHFRADRKNLELFIPFHSFGIIPQENLASPDEKELEDFKSEIRTLGNKLCTKENTTTWLLRMVSMAPTLLLQPFLEGFE